MYFWSV